jgi:nitroimidazol reductase NimA-like FMN-containing flavoprotein (pyridoxamine 5'-phosphate oxidase superfamily)
MSELHNIRAAEIVKRILYITIASVSVDGKPWNTPVYSAFDDDLNFYWASDKNSQHSQNVRTNQDIFLVVYDSTVPEGTGEGVYLQAKAQELTNEYEALAALRVLDERVGKAKERNFSNYSGDAVLRVYKATPQSIWMNDDDKDENGNYIRDIRVEAPLTSLREQLGKLMV